MLFEQHSKPEGLCEHGTCIIVQPMHVYYKKAENGREELQLFQDTKEQEKMSFQMDYTEKRSPELVSPTTYLGLMVLESMRHLQPITGSGTGPPLSSSL